MMVFQAVSIEFKDDLGVTPAKKRGSGYPLYLLLGKKQEDAAAIPNACLSAADC